MSLPRISTRTDFTSSSLASIDQLSLEAIEIVLREAKNIKANPEQYYTSAQNQLMYSIFWAESTRTRLSTETAWTRLGGTVLGVVGTDSSSIKKGETLEHTLHIYAGYQPEVIAIRSHIEGVPEKGYDLFPQISWVNCGDGSNEHPTQALLDTFTLSEYFSDLSKLKIAFVGDIKHGRTIKSLARVLNQFGTSLTFVAPESLHAQAEFEALGISYNKESIDSLADILPNVDVVYATRPQLERMSEADKQHYAQGVYQITPEIMGNAPTLLMHPLPIDSNVLPEIHPALDNDPRSIFFAEAANGLWARMAILNLLRGIIHR